MNEHHLVTRAKELQRQHFDNAHDLKTRQELREVQRLAAEQGVDLPHVSLVRIAATRSDTRAYNELTARLKANPHDREAAAQRADLVARCAEFGIEFPQPEFFTGEIATAWELSVTLAAELAECLRYLRDAGERNPGERLLEQLEAWVRLKVRGPSAPDPDWRPYEWRPER